MATTTARIIAGVGDDGVSEGANGNGVGQRWKRHERVRDNSKMGAVGGDFH